MNLITNIDQYNEDNVYFFDPIKNNIVKNGSFIRIIYSTDRIVLNAIYLAMNIQFTVGSLYYNKLKCIFDVNKVQSIISQIKEIEEKLLIKSNISGKVARYNIYEQLKYGTIKLSIENNSQKTFTNILLKIAGIWETNSEYGLTYKFVAL